MAYAAYRESLGSIASHCVPSPGRGWVVMDITVPSGDALRVRRALVTCGGAGILRCIPRLDEGRVRLEIRLPAVMTGEVMHCVMGCVPDGEIGHPTSWRSHLRRHGLTHGL